LMMIGYALRFLLALAGIFLIKQGLYYRKIPMHMFFMHQWMRRF
jgi:hypothetical protein